MALAMRRDGVIWPVAGMPTVSKRRCSNRREATSEHGGSTHFAVVDELANLTKGRRPTEIASMEAQLDRAKANIPRIAFRSDTRD